MNATDAPTDSPSETPTDEPTVSPSDSPTTNTTGSGDLIDSKGIEKNVEELTGVHIPITVLVGIISGMVTVIFLCAVYCYRQRKKHKNAKKAGRREKLNKAQGSDGSYPAGSAANYAGMEGTIDGLRHEVEKLHDKKMNHGRELKDVKQILLELQHTLSSLSNNAVGNMAIRSGSDGSGVVSMPSAAGPRRPRSQDLAHNSSAVSALLPNLNKPEGSSMAKMATLKKGSQPGGASASRRRLQAAMGRQTTPGHLNFNQRMAGIADMERRLIHAQHSSHTHQETRLKRRRPGPGQQQR